jgi:hypothetical protein
MAHTHTHTLLLCEGSQHGLREYSDNKLQDQYWRLMAKLSPARRPHMDYENWLGYATASIVQIIHSIHCNRRQSWIQTVVFNILPLIQKSFVILLIVMSTCKWMYHKFWCSERFLNALAKLRKATISSVMPIYPAVRMEQIGSHWTNSNEIWNLGIFRKSVQKFQISIWQE